MISNWACSKQKHSNLVGIPDPKDGEGNHVLAPKDVPRAAAARHTRDFASEMKQKWLEV